MTDLIRRDDALAACQGMDPEGDINNLPAVTVGVKPLVWGSYPNSSFASPDVAVADAPFSHRYQVQRDSWAQGYIAFLHPTLPSTSSTLWWESKGHANIEAAKAAAQADYERRILAALEPVAAPDVRLETMSENIARDMREGRFPERSEPQMVPAEPVAAPDPAAIREAHLAFLNVDYQVQDEGEFTERAWEQLRAAILALIQKGAADDRA